jgi:RimJ/RimL family protein N-acetyltransferase
MINAAERHAEMGYWVGAPYWSQGYGAEAAAAVVRYGFEALDLHRIHANHYTRNPASGRIMQKIGMQHEGRMREHALHWGQFEDIELYGLLRPEWQALQRG